MTIEVFGFIKRTYEDQKEFEDRKKVFSEFIPEPVELAYGIPCMICNKVVLANQIPAYPKICEECRSRLNKILYPESDPELCSQDEIQHVGYDDMQLGREK